MTSRERVIASFEHREPDRVPVAFGNAGAWGIMDAPPYGYRSLCQYLGIHDYEEPKTNFLLIVNNCDERLTRRLNNDFIHINQGAPENVELPGGLLRTPGMHNAIWRKATYRSPGPVNGHARTIYLLSDKHAPLHNVTNIKDVESHEWSDYDDPIYCEDKRNEAKKASEETDYAVIALDWASSAGLLYTFLFGFDRWLMDMKIRPDFYLDAMEILWQKQEVLIRNWYREVGDYIDVADFYDDIAGQNGMFMSLEDFRRFVGQYWERYLREARKYTRAKFIIHECGAIYDIYPDIIRQGWDGHQSVHTKGAQMDPRRIKKEFGDRLLFFGGLDVQNVLPFGSKEEIVEHVRELMHSLAPNGGYIFSPVHDIGSEIPPENIVTAFDAVQEFGNYPIK
jgi:uroporphyrinogen decarboxylase